MWKRCICSLRSGLGSVDEVGGPVDEFEGVGVGVVMVAVAPADVVGVPCSLLCSCC